MVKNLEKIEDWDEKKKKLDQLRLEDSGDDRDLVKGVINFQKVKFV